MRQVVICGDNIRELQPDNPSVQTIQMDGVPVTCALIETEDTPFDPEDEALKSGVLLRKIAFTANYRDKALIHANALKSKMGNEHGKVYFFPFGSDFVAEVVAIGKAVEGIQVGDRVINNGHYPDVQEPGVRPGLPTNNASKEIEVIPYQQLVKVPKEVSDEAAASMTIGGITSYQMVRKLNIRDGDNVLVTAAKSNTSLFGIGALKKYTKANVFALSTSKNFESELKELGIKELIIVDPKKDTFLENEQLLNVVKQFGLFNCVFDPFFDLHLGKLIDFMANGARYTFCGLYNQYSDMIGENFQYKGKPLEQLMTEVMVKNIQILGNCLGLESDLKQAVDDNATGKFPIVIDSVHQGNSVADFMNRTYTARDRFGKVVYKY